MEELQVIEIHEAAEAFPMMDKKRLQELADDIQQEGQKETIKIYDNKIIDGRNRYEACNQIGVTPKFETIEVEDPWTYVWSLNGARRDIVQDQRYLIWKHCHEKSESFQAVKLQIKEEADKARSEAAKGNDNAAKDKVDKNSKCTDCTPTVLMEKPKPERTAKAKASKTNAGAVARGDKLDKDRPDLAEKVRKGEIKPAEAYREMKKDERSKLAEEGSKREIDIDFRLGDFEEVFSDLPDNSVDCIITDPPYPYEFIDVWSKLSRFAKRVLKPHGYCIAYSGQMHLPEVMKRMGENLDYYWTFAMYHEGQTQIVNGVNLICRWKPVLIFQNSKKKIENTFQDYFISEKREKAGHDWQQSQSGVAYLVEMFTKPGDLIVEPFAGSGTTLIVAKQKGRSVKGAEIDENTYNIAKATL